MSLLYPIFIYLLLPVTLILFYFIMTGSKASFSMFDKAVLNRLRHENKSLSRPARNTLYLVAFLSMILALSQPVIKDGEIVVEAKSADILIGIDISDSMMAEDRYPNRLDFAKEKAISLIKQAPHNRIGVLAFAKHDYIVSPLSFDHSSVAFLLSKVQTKSITEKGTHLDSMLKSAISMLEHADTKNLLLFTDGGDEKDFSDEISLAKENGLRLFIIGVGTAEGSPVRSPDGGFIKHNGNILISKLNPAIKSLATDTGGVYIESVLGDKDIKAMLDEIESITEKSTLKEETIPQYTQLFYYPLSLSVLFFLLAFSSFPKRSVGAVILLSFISLSSNEAQAGLLDFKKLEEAKTAYANGDYKKSATVYEDFAVDSSEGAYNLGNSLYKDKEYERALKVYERVATEDKDFKAKALHNSGNAHVQLKQYKEALKAYEEALSLKEDKETQENYEAVKKFLEEQKKEEEKKKNEEQNQEDKKDSEDKQDSKDQESSDKKEQSEDKESKDSKSENDQKSEKQDAKEKSEKNEDKQSNDSKGEQKEQDSQDKQEDKKEEDKKAADNSSEKSQEQEQEEAAAEQKDKGETEEHAVPVNMKKMSELEAKKWLKAIQQSQKGHLYKMQDLEHNEDSNENPW